MALIAFAVGGSACDKKGEGAVVKKAPTGYELDERGREETRTRPHISGRAELSTLPFVVKVTDAPDEVARKVEKGFCKALTKALGNRCSGPRKAKVRLWVSEIDVELREVAGSIVVDIIGSTLLNEGWETADLSLRYGVDGKAPEGVDEAVLLGKTLGARWATELQTYLKKMVVERKPSTNVQWVAAPGFMREDTWPLDYGFAEIVADRTWTFQRGTKTKQRVGYLIDGKGTVMRSESFETADSEGKQAGWGTRADEHRRALVMALPMTAADKTAMKEQAAGAMFAVVVLTRSGEARMVGRDAGHAVSPPVIVDSGDVALVTLDKDGKARLGRIDGMSGKASHHPLPVGASTIQRFDLLKSGKDRLLVVPAAPGTEVYAATLPPAGGAAEPASVFYRFKDQPGKSAPMRRHARLAVTDAAGALALVDGQQLVVVEPGGAERFRYKVGDGALELAVVGGMVAVMKKDEMLAVDASKGTLTAKDKRTVNAIVASKGTGYVACADPGLVQYDANLVAKRSVRLDDRCEDLHVTPDGEVIAARFLWVARVDVPSKWPIATAAP